MEPRAERGFGDQVLGWSPTQVQGTNRSPWQSRLPLGRGTSSAGGCWVRESVWPLSRWGLPAWLDLLCGSGGAVVGPC